MERVLRVPVLSNEHIKIITMQNTPDDLAKMSEQYAKIMEQTMAAALANMEAIQAEAQKAHVAALDEQAAAREEKRRIEASAQQAAEAYIEQHRQQLEAETRQKTLLSVVKKLLEARRSDAEIRDWLAVPEAMLEEAHAALGFKKLGAADARVRYEQEGRGGTVIFERGATVLRFYWEFGGGDALALVFVPEAGQWEAQTGLPLAERLPVLDFVAARILADRGGRYYKLEGNALVIMND